MPKRPPSTPKDDERGVSEVLGQILVFSVVVASIGFIIATGFAGLENTRDTERFQNADRAFDVLADNMASVIERNNPSRGTEIDVGDSQIGYADEVEMEILVEDEDTEFLNHSSDIRPIEFSVTQDRSIVYEGGAVIRDEQRGGFMVRNPPFLLTDKRIHLPVIETFTTNDRQIGGTTVLVRTISNDREVLLDPTGLEDPGDLEMSITLNSPRAEQWENYFESNTQGDWGCELDDEDEVTCTSELEEDVQVYVVSQTVRVSMDT